MRSHHDSLRVLLPLRELREHERVLVIASLAMGLPLSESGICNLKSRAVRDHVAAIPCGGDVSPD